MKLIVETLLTVVIAIGAVSFAESSPSSKGDGQPDGKKSLGGSGEMIQFDLSKKDRHLAGIKIHGSRYGIPEAPNESFLIYVMNNDQTEVIATEMAPYSLFERGEEKWVTVKFHKPIDVPENAWIAVDFRAGRTKGVYVSFDSSTDGKRSRIGLPGIPAKPTDFTGDWMIEPMIAQ